MIVGTVVQHAPHDQEIVGLNPGSFLFLCLLCTLVISHLEQIPYVDAAFPFCLSMCARLCSFGQNKL